MALWEHFASEIKALRSDINRMDAASVQYLPNNIHGSLKDILGRAQNSSDLKALTDSVQDGTSRLAEAINRSWTGGADAQSEIQAARDAALERVDRLEAALADAKPDAMKRWILEP